MAAIDPFLVHSFESLSDANGLETMSFHQEETVLPMLVRFRDGARVVSALGQTELQVTSRVGDIVSCLGTYSSLLALQENADVLSVEMSRPTSGNDCAV